MSDEEKTPWKRKADEVKEQHRRMFPGYEYRPTNSDALSGRRRVVKGRGEREVGEARKKCKVVAQLVKNGMHGQELEKVVSEMEKSKEKPKSAIEEGRNDKSDSVFLGDDELPRRFLNLVEQEKTAKGPIERSILPHREVHIDENGDLAPADPHSAWEDCIPGGLVKRKGRQESKWREHSLNETTDGLDRDKERASASDESLFHFPILVQPLRTFDETGRAKSASVSVSARSSPPFDERELSLPPLFSLPNTFIPPGHELESELFSTKFFASLFPPAGRRFAERDGVRNQIPDPELGSRTKITLPPILPPLNTGTLPDAAGRASKLILKARRISRKFPGALHVPNKPRSSSATGSTTPGRDSKALKDNNSDRSLLYSRDRDGGSYPASASASRDYESGSSSFLSPIYALHPSSPYKETTDPERDESTVLDRSWDSIRNESQVSSRIGGEPERRTLCQVDPQPHHRLRPRLSNDAMGRHKKTRKPETEFDSGRSVVGSLSPRSATEARD